MISWIQRNFQQHFKWLFLILLVLVIVSFVVMDSLSSNLRGGGAKISERPFFGLNLAQKDDVQRLVGDAQISLFLRQSPFRPQPSEAEVEQYALQRHAALHFADKLGLAAPTPDSPELAEYIQTLGRFTGPDGNFDRKAYAAFADELKKNPRGFTEADVARVLIDDVRAETYKKLLAGPGYVLDSDLAEQLARRDTRWTLALASIDGQSFAPKIDSSDAALAAWFENNARRYEIPPRVSVAAINFPASGFADSVKPTDAQIRAHFDADPSRYPAPEVKPPEIKIDAAANPDAAFAAVRPQVEADLRKELANRSALAAADDLTVKLLEQRVALDRLPAFLASKNLALEDLGPVGNGSIPASLGGAAAAEEVAPEALRLSSERPYSNPLVTPSGAAVLVWRETLPARVPALAEVRENALADYQAAEKRRLFSEAGRKLRESVATALASGKTFADALKTEADAAGLKVDLTTPAPFTLAEPPRDIDFTAFQALATLAELGVSDFLPARGETGLLVHALKKEVPAFDPASPAAAEVKRQMAPFIASRNAQAMLASLVEAELAKTAPLAE